jgi:hypothetical protein
MSYKAANLPQEKHCFFGSNGGVSQGRYNSLNTNTKSQDSKENVLQNFAVIAGCFNKKRQDMFVIHQGVSATAVEATTPEWYQTYADGAVTANPDILLGIKTADCTPVLLADYKHRVIGVAHAGWRGAYKGIIENVVKLMLKNGADTNNIAAAVGPCLQKKSFAVKDDMRQIIIARNSDYRRFFFPTENDGSFLFDMENFVINKLHECNIQNITASGIDTFPNDSGYFSYRREMRNNAVKSDGDYPTQYSCICL